MKMFDETDQEQLDVSYFVEMSGQLVYMIAELQTRKLPIVEGDSFRYEVFEQLVDSLNKTKELSDRLAQELKD